MVEKNHESKNEAARVLVNPKVEALKQELESAQKARDKVSTALTASKKKIEELEKENAQLRALAQQLREDAPPELGDGAYLLTRSVTFGTDDGKPANGQVGDVVVLADINGKPTDSKEFEAKLGPGYKVHLVSLATLDMLSSKGFLRG